MVHVAVQGHAQREPGPARAQAQVVVVEEPEPEPLVEASDVLEHGARHEQAEPGQARNLQGPARERGRPGRGERVELGQVGVPGFDALGAGRSW
ncbi:hypothetical protein [Gemmata massiliana]|uniref:hypothetical protein n=1 Tax=Gemmata massiliana TaxID=1210884 RepID=UPI0013A6FF68|nr:hypothetical protein [Gemmata massiliana]